MFLLEIKADLLQKSISIPFNCKYFLDQECNALEIEEQVGFRSGRSTIDQMFSIQQVIEKRIARGRPLLILFIYLKKAYDSGPQTKSWEILKSLNINYVHIL